MRHVSGGGDAGGSLCNPQAVRAILERERSRGRKAEREIHLQL